MWNYGGGGGEHAVEVDAFSRTENRFIPDFFVDVLPDGPPDPTDPTAGGPLSRIANYDGYVATGTLTKPVEIRAREIIGDGTERYRFVRWVEVESLTSGEPMPFVDNDRIVVHPGNIMRAFAISTVFHQCRHHLYDQSSFYLKEDISSVSVVSFTFLSLGPEAGQDL